MNPWLAVILALAALAVILLGAGYSVRRGTCSAETGRKSVHLLLGCLAMGFPWIFRAIWPVWLLAALALLALAVIRVLRPAASPERRALHGVRRESYGEFCFPLGVAMVFSISSMARTPYLLAVAALTLADAAGALVGQRWGRHVYATDEGTKTWEGSLAVLGVTFVAAWLLLQLGANRPPWNAFLMALLIGLLTMLVEAIALRGFDNLFIPVLVWILADRYAQLDTVALAVRLLVLALIAVGMSWWRKGTRLNETAVMGCAVLLYMAGFLAGWPWLVPPLVTAGVYYLLNRSPERESRHTLGAASAVLGPACFWLMLHGISPGPADFFCYVIGFGCACALMAAAEWQAAPVPAWLHLAGAATVGALSAIPGLALANPARGVGVAVALVWCGCLVAATFFQVVELQRRVDHGRDIRWLIQGAINLLLATGGHWL